ncbi:MAG: glycine cleavage system aminomethyltransferase GcvT [Chloroflexota bacterium]|nr:glycine cleavage system aminomethyltransferase GcvT [Chloroflexota bacterium]
MTSDAPLLRTALYENHVAAGARMVPFAGWDMPVQYQGVIAEVKAVRGDAGIFDVSHMGRLSIHGAGAASFMDSLVTFSVMTLATGRARYGFMLSDNGGILDDVILYHTQFEDGSDMLRLVCNAGNRDAVKAWMAQQSQAFRGVTVIDHTADTVLVAVQGPRALDIVDGLCPDEPKPSALRPFGAAPFPLTVGDGAVAEGFIGRTGYTGEDGVEIAMEAAYGGRLWEALAAAGATPCGLGARDVLRLEAGLRLHGSDMDLTTTPLEASLERFVNMDKGIFHGRDALELQDEDGLRRKLVGFRMLGGGVPRHGCDVLYEGETIGEITSGTYSPILDTGIAMGYVSAEHTAPGQRVHIDLRGRLVEAEVAELPFYRRPKSQ